jgi:hypothetical protein
MLTYVRDAEDGTVRLAIDRGLWQGRGHENDTQSVPGLPFPAETINKAVWLYHCFSLSLREVELILAARASWSATRLFASGACALGAPTP